MREYLYTCMKKMALCMMVITILSVAAFGEQVQAAEVSDHQAVAVELPQNLNFYLDPENKYGRGQIYSERYEVKNLAEETTDLSMEMMLEVVDSEALIQFSPNEEFDAAAGRSIYMYAVFEGAKGKEICILTDPEASCEKNLVLEPAGTDGDSVYISFGGMLSTSEGWKSGELTVNAIYDMPENVLAGDEISLVGSHIRVEKEVETTVTGGDIELCLVPDDQYYLPSEIQVYADGVKRDVLYDAVTGKVILQNVSGPVVIYANGITHASLPGIEILDMEKAVWTWAAEEGVQAYQYAFLQNDETIATGSIDVENGMVSWNWSEGLADGIYQLCLRAIGDNVYCVNSEEGYYTVTVDGTAPQLPEDISGSQETEPGEEPAADSELSNEDNNVADSELSDKADNPADSDESLNEVNDSENAGPADNTENITKPEHPEEEESPADQKPSDWVEGSEEPEQSADKDISTDTEPTGDAEDIENPADGELAEDAEGTEDQTQTDHAKDPAEEVVEDGKDPAEEGSVEDAKDPAAEEVVENAENATIEELIENAENVTIEELIEDAKDPAIEELIENAENVTIEELIENVEDPAIVEFLEDAKDSITEELTEDAEIQGTALVFEDGEVSLADNCEDILDGEIFEISGAGIWLVIVE